MKEELTKLRNTLYEVETKGQSTVVMSECLKYLNALIEACDDEGAEK